MKNLLLGSLLLVMLTTCRSGLSEMKIRKQAFSIAQDYSSGQVSNGRKIPERDGIILIQSESKRYIIDPSKIYVGCLDNDSLPDALVTLFSYERNRPEFVEHLVIKNTGKKMELLTAIESDMRIIRVKDGIITAEIHTRPKSSPLYNCRSCMEIVKYRFNLGELVRTDK